MARLRTLLITDIEESGRARSRDILILDDLTPDQAASILDGAVSTDDAPPIFAFDFPVELPEAAEGELDSFNSADEIESPNLLRQHLDEASPA